jgi:hypothetical protein
MKKVFLILTFSATCSISFSASAGKGEIPSLFDLTTHRIVRTWSDRELLNEERQKIYNLFGESHLPLEVQVKILGALFDQNPKGRILCMSLFQKAKHEKDKTRQLTLREALKNKWVKVEKEDGVWRAKKKDGTAFFLGSFQEVLEPFPSVIVDLGEDRFDDWTLSILSHAPMAQLKLFDTARKEPNYLWKDFMPKLFPARQSDPANSIFPNLTTLKIDSALDDSEAVKIFASCPAFEHLTSLKLFIRSDQIKDYIKEEIKTATNLFKNTCIPGLTALDLSASRIHQEGLTYLVGNPSYSSLTNLSLRNNNIKNSYVLVLCSRPASSLITLDLAGNKISSRGIAYLTQNSLFSFPNLTSLNLCGNEIHDDGALAISSCPSFTNLQVLDLSMTYLEVKGFLGLFQSKHLSGLKRLALNKMYYHGHTGKLIENLGLSGHSLGNLAHLSLSRCYGYRRELQFTESAVEEIRQAFPTLEEDPFSENSLIVPTPTAF